MSKNYIFVLCLLIFLLFLSPHLFKTAANIKCGDLFRGEIFASGAETAEKPTFLDSGQNNFPGRIYTGIRGFLSQPPRAVFFVAEKISQAKKFFRQFQNFAGNALNKILSKFLAAFSNVFGLTDERVEISNSALLPSAQPRAAAQNTLALPSPSAIFEPAPPIALIQKPVVMVLPRDKTVFAKEKETREAALGEEINERIRPDEQEVPLLIFEQTTPKDIAVPSPSPVAAPEPESEPRETGVSAGGGGEPAPLPSPSPAPPATTTPDTLILSQPPNPSASTTAIFMFDSPVATSTFACQLDDGTSTFCVSPQEYTGLAEGAHIFQVKAIDAFGNNDPTPAQYSWLIDASAPVISNISSSPRRNSAVISWESNEPGIFQLAYGTSTEYGFLSATTSLASLTISFLAPSAVYHFRLLAADNLANATTSADYFFTTTSRAENAVISEIAARGPSGAGDEFIEIYNPTNQVINLKDWSLQYASALATSTTAWDYKYFSVNGKPSKYFPNFALAPGQYFLLTSSTTAATTTDGYSYGAAPDLTAVTSAGTSTALRLSDSGGKIRLLDSQARVIDLVGWGAVTLGAEGSPVVLIKSWQWGSLERKVSATSTAESLAAGSDNLSGNGYDTDNNFQDFVLQNNPEPQNSLMPPEP